jgi:hypothetical protein
MPLAALNHCRKMPVCATFRPKRAAALSVSITNRRIRQQHYSGLALLASASTIMDLV